MKRNFNLPVLFCLGLFLAACKKEAQFSPGGADPLIESARNYFIDSVRVMPVSENPRAVAAREVCWERATVVDLSIGKAVLAPVKYDKELFIRTTQGGPNNFPLSNLTRLLIYRGKGGFHAEVVTGLPDTNYLRHPGGPFSGLAYVEDWAGHSLGKYLYTGKGILKYAAPAASSPLRSLSVAPLEVCYQLTGYNYSLAMPYGGYAWAEAPVCTPSMVPLDDPMEGYPGGADYGAVAGGGGSSGNSGAGNFTVFVGHNLITNVKDYFRCFTNTSSATFQVMVCVDQPEPGKRTAWSFSPADGSSAGVNPFDVGHTFLVFTENNGGDVVQRNVGFYPANTVDPIYTSARGTLNNDEMHYYNISATFTVNSALFFNMLNFVSLGNTAGYTYDLNDNNCTTFAINALATGHIYLPSTIGSWFGGMGNDPGDLGEDIRATDFTGMSRSTDQEVHMNAGTCN